MPKDALLYDRLCELQLAGRTFRPQPPCIDTLCLVHDETYVNSFIEGTIDAAAMRRIGLPWSPALVQRTLIGVGSAIMAARLALQYGVACMCNGGTHHSHKDHGSGWCIFNDQAIAARSVQRDAGVEKVLFCDLDTHQGDGTASIFANDPSVFTLSLHCEAQPFPLTLQKSDLDVPLPAGCTDSLYVETLRQVLPNVLDSFQPDLVMYNAGTDVHVDDSLGKMSLTTQGILERDRFVMKTCADRRIPVAAAIGGGYDPCHDHIVERHVALHRAAAEYAESLLYSTPLARTAKAKRMTPVP